MEHEKMPGQTDTREHPSVEATTPPFRADHVGSLLRTPELKLARETILGPHTAEANIGPHGNAALAAIEDQHVRDAIAMQERVGLKVATDGELRRRSWMLELFLGWDGIGATRSGGGPIKWRSETGASQDMTEFRVERPIQWGPSAIVQAFRFLKAETDLVPKVGLPSPCVVHYFLEMGGKLNPEVYRDQEAFWRDLIRAFRREITALVDAGATYIQIDDVCFAYLCDPVHRAHVQSRGYDPDALVRLYTQRINEAISVAPDHVTFTMHTCRGNREGHWVAEGAYDAVAEVLFNEMNVKAFFLEYDTDRAGGFGPLRFLPPGKMAVLGLVSSKVPALESETALTRRIDEAADVVPLDRLAISPQCGFASSYRGNPLTIAQQEAKLRRLVEVAERVWGTA
jgi:5-methyltetrahydropteroyltriglutamate--homocysteine methyltransferase